MTARAGDMFGWYDGGGPEGAAIAFGDGPAENRVCSRTDITKPGVGGKVTLGLLGSAAGAQRYHGIQVCYGEQQGK